MADLIPVDRERCQAEVRSFMTLGSGYNRCGNKAKFIATEKKAGKDGQKGSMSLCEACRVEFEKRMPNHADIEPIDPEQSDIQKKVQGLIDQGYMQVSHKYRSLAKLPEGMTGLEALAKFAPDFHKDLVRRMEAQARSQFLRVYSKEESIELTQEEFAVFKKLNGPVA